MAIVDPKVEWPIQRQCQAVLGQGLSELIAG